MYPTLPLPLASTNLVATPRMSECPWLFFMLSSLILTDIRMPRLSVDLGIASLNGLNCSSIQVKGIGGVLNSSLFSFSTTEPSTVMCNVGLTAGFLQARLISHVILTHSLVSFEKKASDQCLTTETFSDKCGLEVEMKDLRVDPPNLLLQGLLNALGGTIVSQINAFVCDVFLPSFKKDLVAGVVLPPKPYPPLVNGASPLDHSMLFRAIVNILNSLPELESAQLNASIQDGTTLHVEAHISDSLHLTLEQILEYGNTFIPVFQSLMELLERTSSTNFTQDILGFLPVIENGTGEVNIPNPFTLSFDISFDDFRCDPTSYFCTLPCNASIGLENIRIKGTGDWDFVVVNYVGPLLSTFVNEFVNDTTMKFCDKNMGRVNIPVVKESPTKGMPPDALWGSALAGLLLLIPAGVFFGVWRHKRVPALTRDGTPISMRRVVVEDLVLMMLCTVTAFGFIWSNSTTAATLEIGDEIRVLSFSLMETTTNLYNANLKAFSVLVFFFSGIYPYIKLFCILFCTLILQQPGLLVLRVIDYIGKFSFIDSYAMVIMASGLEIKGIAEVKIHPGFYIFLFSTIMSIIAGNYATALWRRNTSVHWDSSPMEESDSSPKSSILFKTRSFDENANTFRDVSRWNVKFISLRVANGVFVALCILPVWIFPCLRYTVGGAASFLLPEGREMSLFELCSSSIALLMTCIFTIGLAPLFYSITYPKWYLLASWSAADVLLLACVAGVLQLGQFVEFVIGPDMGFVYSARTELLWPLIPLLISSIWQWVLAAELVFGIWGRLDRRWRSRK